MIANFLLMTLGAFFVGIFTITGVVSAVPVSLTAVPAMLVFLGRASATVPFFGLFLPYVVFVLSVELGVLSFYGARMVFNFFRGSGG